MPEEKVHRFSHQAMGTFFEVLIVGQEEKYSRSAAQTFFREIDRLEQLFSRFDPRSEISRINRLQPGEILPIGIETYECLKTSFELMVASGGAFNINYWAIKREAGDNQEKMKKERGEKEGDEGEEKRSSEPVEIDKIRSVFGGRSGQQKPEKENFWQRLFPLELIEIEGKYFAARLDVAGSCLDLDLGAIGKGYALEKAASIFEDWQISDFLVNAGESTVYAHGQRTWPVLAGGGFDFFRPKRVYLQARALSGSGHEVKGEHIFDPRLGVQKSRQLAVWVSHPSPTLSDALSTAFMVMDPEEIKAYSEKQAGIWTLVLARDKKSYLFRTVEIYEEEI